MATVLSQQFLDHTSRVKTMYSTNKYQSIAAPRLAEDVRFKDIEYPKTLKTDPGYMSLSHASTFASNGLVDHKGIPHVRDPRTGTWFKDRPNHKKEFFHTGSELTMRFTDEAIHKPKPGTGGSFRNTKEIWIAPCGRPCWIDKQKDQPRVMIFSTTGDVSESFHGKTRPCSAPAMRSRRPPMDSCDPFLQSWRSDQLSRSRSNGRIRPNSAPTIRGQ
mmetsp:Transcript_126162/g.223493  ORF Transcript_126162/g.223493 Transcript_126162/m.223493 type:complete len:217 (+) Transcript_126162:61-711(+)